MRTEDSNGKSGLSLMFPAQSFALTELAGFLNLLTFDQETGGVNYSTYSGFYELNATGQFINFEVCQFSSTCNTTPFRPSPTVNLAGGFDYKDVNGESIRAFGFKSADGSIIFIAVRANAGGITIAAPRKALNPVSAWTVTRTRSFGFSVDK